MRRRYRVLLWLAGALMTLPLLLAAGFYLLANSANGRSWIERATASLTHGNVRLIGLGGHFPDAPTLDRLELRDPQGLWLSIDRVALRWSPSALLDYTAEVALLSAAHVDMPRAPAYPSEHKPPVHRHWPLLRISRLEVERADLGAPLTGAPVALELIGDGVWSSPQQAVLALEARRLDAVPSLYRASARFDAQRLEGRLDVQEDAGGPLAHLAQVPTIGALSIHLALAGPREAVKTNLSLQAGVLRSNIDGTVNVRTGSAALALALDADAMSPRPGISWRRVHLEGEWRGAPTAPVTRATLEATGVEMPGVQLPTLSAGMSGQGGTLTLDARASGLVLPGRLATLLAASPLTARAIMHLNQPRRPIELTASHALLSLSGHWSGGGSDGIASLSATLNDLKPLAGIAALDLSGRGTLEAQFHGMPDSSSLELSSALNISGGAAPLATLLAPSSALSAALRFDAGGVEVVRAQVTSARAQASVRGRIDAGALNLGWKATLPDLAALSPRLAGNAEAQGQLNGQAPRLAVLADVDGRISINGTQSGALHLKLRGQDLPQRPVGDVALTGTLDGAPLWLDASIHGANGGLEARIDRGSWKSLQAQGQVRIPGGSGAPRGQLELDMAHLEDLANLLEQPLQGSLDARVDFDGAAPGGRARLRVHAKDAGVPAQQLTVLNLEGQVDSVTTTPVLALRLSTRALIKDVPSNLQAQIQGPLSAVALKLRAATEGDETTRSRINATATLDVERRELRVGTLELTYRGEDAHLLAPASLSFAGGFSVDRLRLGVGEAAVLEAQGRVTPQLDLTASLRNLTSDLLRPWLPGVKSDGQVDIDAELHGEATAPSGHVRVIGRGLRARSGSVRGLPAGNLTLEAELQQTVAQVKLDADAGEHLQLHLSGQAPMNRNAPMAMTAHGSFDLLLLNPILEAGGQRVLGQAKLDADVAGTPADPQAHGSVVLTHAEFQDYPRGLHLTDIGGTLAADGDRVTLQDLAARAGAGTITASGTLGLGDDLPVDIKLQAHNARPLASDLITANVDTELTLKGSAKTRIEAAGQLNIIRADLNIPNALPPTVAVLDVRKPGQQVQPPKPSQFVMALDLRVEAPRAVFVRGRGLDAELGGSLHVGGTAEEPNISGGFDMRSGTINLAGSTLTFTSGRLSFNGTGIKKKIDPTLDFVATNLSGGVTYMLHVGGYADAPVITLSSTPEQPQDQILSRLLFGADPAQLSTLQVAQIAAALATMSGVGGGLNPLTAVQRRLGLDRLAISGNTGSATTTAAGTSAQGTNNSATIEAGRYVSSRIYVGAKQFTTGTTQAQVQIDLTKNLKIQTTLATGGGGTVQGETPQNDPGSSVGLSYQFEY